MYLEELVIDGFKSYATRTVISGWDRELNAITGLNGSGKSNILDAICFVLGISNLSQLRAASLKDLVYKRGKAGITKASVTAVFNNEDQDKSPVGYEDSKQIMITRQIVIGGQSKWIVNGHNAQQHVVAELYQGVHLDINNPHFLIMQGRITKVLNMKPPDVLAMIEEASGTRMYQDHKDKAIKSVAEMDMRLEKINLTLEGQIMPKIEKLAEEKRQYLEYQNINAELDRITRMLIAHKYKRLEDILVHSEQELNTKKTRMNDIVQVCMELEATLRGIEQRQAEQQAMKKGHQGLQQQQEDELAKAMDRCKAQYNLQTSAIAEEQKNLAQLQELKEEAEESLIVAQKRQEEIINRYNISKAGHDTNVAHLSERENLLQNLRTGISSGGNNQGGYIYHLQQAMENLRDAQSGIEQTTLKISQLEKEVNKAKPKCQQESTKNEILANAISTAKEAIARIDAEIVKINFDHDRHEVLMQEKKQLFDSTMILREQIDKLIASVPGATFDYKDPAPNFDRSKVKGVCVELFTLSDNDKQWSTALEICAGGRLYYVVVDDSQVGKQLLTAGQTRRMSFIPLNTIEYAQLDPKKVDLIESRTPGRVIPAISIVHYENVVEKAMRHIFGSTILSRDATAAEMVAFNKDIRLKAITMDGDIYESSGMIEGGSRPVSNEVIVKMQKVQMLRRAYGEAQIKLGQVNQDLDASNKHLVAYNSFIETKELKEHEMRLLVEKLATNSSTIKQISDMEDQIKVLQQDLDRHTASSKESQGRVVSIEKEISDLSNHREAKLKSIETEVTETRAAVAQGVDLLNGMEFERQVAMQEVAQWQGEIETFITQIKAAQNSIEENIGKQRTLKEQLAVAKFAHDEAYTKLEQERKQWASFDSELQKLQKDYKSIEKQLAASNLESQTLSLEIERSAADRMHASGAVSDLTKQHAWIPDHKHLFGQHGTQYEFENSSIDEAKKEKKQLEDQSARLKNSLNHQAIASLAAMEKVEASLKQMFSTIKKDKRKIEEAIESLDEFKRDALLETWEKVNGDFGSIFGELLPGNSAKLEPPEGADMAEGLEIKVRIGTIWKQSLTELSGGQRSLIALSLMLSLLQFNPAPMYILDEVDAALDLSHTQSIGHLFRTRFKKTQFIIVTLKDGMFNNANVLFKAKFREGVSTVERRVQKPSAGAKPSDIRSANGKEKGYSSVVSVRGADRGVIG